MATELAKAYVQIIPSARGIRGSITSALGGEADSAGASAGQSFGGKMMGALKGVIAVAAIGKALAATISEGSALQQSIGGIETLFKGSSDTIKKYASEAYRTAGLSANDYMETVTGFSASLLQGLGGDTAKAADISNMAITDMSDNANKMGTSMDSIQIAYQGFAKQNYTMLDNLKLGYGGTKTEMARLLVDAQKITGVKYDMSNLSDVYSAIHVIQGELDITGTTAKEASTTIAGSIASMKSAFSNVLGQLTLGQDIGPALSALAQTMTTFLVGNLLPAVWNIISALPSALVTFIQAATPQLVAALTDFIPRFTAGVTSALPQMLEMATQIISQLCAGIQSGWPMLLQRGGEILTQIISGIASIIPQVWQIAMDVVSNLYNTFIENYPLYIKTGTSILLTLIDGIRQALPKMLLAAADAILSMVSGVIKNLPQILAAGFEMIVSLISGIGNALPDIGTAAGQVAHRVFETILETDWLQLGKDIIRGLIDGIGAMSGALWDAAVNIAKSALNAIKSFFGIASPSKLMRDEVGKFIPAGIAAGIKGNTKPIISAMHGLTDLTTGTLQANMSTQLLHSGHALSSAGSPPGVATNRSEVNTLTINTHDSLSPAEITREIQKFKTQTEWKNP